MFAAKQIIDYESRATPVVGGFSHGGRKGCGVKERGQGPSPQKIFLMLAEKQNIDY